MDPGYRRRAVAVTGGELAVGEWGTGDRLVVASHGITANHLSWLRVAELVVERDPSVLLVAPDHRGRAGSATTPGPYGLERHADDLAALVDHYGHDDAVVLGHSMGAFVAALTGERHPEAVRRLVLVDGGLPLEIAIPEGADIEAVVASVLGPALDRLDMRWPDEDAYVDFYRAHPAFVPPNEWPAAVEAYVRHDAVEDADGTVTSSVIKEAVLVDGGAELTDPGVARAVERVATPTTLLWAPRDLFDQEPGLYSPHQVFEADSRLSHLDTRLVPDTNHYTIVVGESGASEVASAVLAALDA